MSDNVQHISEQVGEEETLQRGGERRGEGERGGIKGWWVCY